MENQEYLQFIYSPVNDKPPLAVLIAENEEIIVHKIKKMLLKSLGREEVSISRIPLAKISQEKNYSLLGDFEIVKGMKGMDKFVYAFELSDSPHTYRCLLCRRMCDCELKKHVGNNCLFVMCDFCNNNFFKIQSKDYKCPVCLAKVSMLSFIKIGESVPAISMLNVPLVLDKLNIDIAVNELCKNFGEPRLIQIPFKIHSNKVPQKGEYSVHFVYHGDHDCNQCFYQQGSTICDPPEPEKKISKENALSDINDNKIPKSTPPIDENNFQKQLSISRDVSEVVSQSNSCTNTKLSKYLLEEDKIDIFLENLQQQRDKTLIFYTENSQQIVNEGLRNLSNEFERFTKVCGKSRFSRNINPFENLKFTGRNDFMHPMRFIKDFEFFATCEKLNDYEQQFFFGKSLTEEAAKWLKIRGYGRTFPEMKESFLNFFWSEDDQNRLRNFLRHGKFNKESGLSMSEYFYKYACEANYLDNAPKEEVLIEWLSQHFGIMVQAKIYGNHVKKFNEALHSLKNLEISYKNGNPETPETSETPEIPTKAEKLGNLKKAEKPEDSEESENSEDEKPYNFFSSSSLKKIKTGLWTDCFGFDYEQIMKNGERFYRCITERIWPLHSLSYNNSQSDIQHFDVSCHKASSKFLTTVPCRLHHIYVDIKGDSVEYRVLGPITIAKQNGNQLIVSTCPSFKSYMNLVTGQLLYIQIDDCFKPCGVITCSIPEDSSYRYVIPNSNEQIVCLPCKDKIEEIPYRESRVVAVGNLAIRYFEQRFKKRRHFLRFLNENFCTVYTVWDDAVDEYNPLKPTYH